MADDRKPAQFVHLRVKSAYSLLEGAIRPDELAELARANAMPAVAVTDVNNLFGVYEASDSLADRRRTPVGRARSKSGAGCCGAAQAAALAAPRAE
jgi:hypothetical protein